MSSLELDSPKSRWKMSPPDLLIIETENTIVSYFVAPSAFEADVLDALPTATMVF